jgi:predicted membrane protein
MPSILREVLTMLVLYFVVSLIVVGLVSWLINYRIPLAATTKTILNVVLALILVGMFLWLIDTYIPMEGVIKAILNIVVVVATCVRVLQAVGLWSQTVRLWNNVTHYRMSTREDVDKA